jgi:hypothetical protein
MIGVAGQLSELVYGRLFEGGVTEAAGPAAGVLAQVRYGPNGSEPWRSGWIWSPAAFNTQVSSDDEYQGQFTLPAAGNYRYGFRFSFDSGASYTYCELDGAGSNSGLVSDRTQLGTLTVTP